ncbi:MAG: MlaD family protein [Nocardioides sp.]|uniref:MCE family protein n=1 Tax=Nocardioides sp. TaxID=35761 RepID=UPI0039E6F1CF
MRVRSELIKLSLFGVVGLIVATLLFLTLGRTQVIPSTSYTALMANVSGLEKGDVVRIAGVRVGQVDGVRLTGGNVVKVEFHADSQRRLTDQTQVHVRYENLLGDRYLDLTQPEGVGRRLHPGEVIPTTRTEPALDLDVLLNGFRPLFRGLQPDQVNGLATNLIRTLQGQGGTVQSLLSQVGSLTGDLADDDKEIGDLITNMNALLGTINGHDDQLSQTIVQFRTLVSKLSKDRDPVAQSVTQIDTLTGRLTSLFTQIRGPFHSTVIAVNDLAKILDTNEKTLRKVLAQLPAAYRLLDRVGSHGNFFNFYLCSVQVEITGPNGKPIKTPVVRSQVKRCN